MPDSNLVHQLAQAGLETAVATAYLRALEEGGTQVSGPHAEALIAAGLAERDAAGDLHLHAPEAVLTRRALEQESSARRLRELGPQLQALYRMSAAAPDPSVQHLRSAESLREAFTAVLSGARQVMRALDRGPYVSTRAHSPTPEQLAAMAAGVEYHVIYAAEVFDQEATRDEVYAAVRAGEQARVLPDVPMKILLADDRLGLVARVTGEGRAEGFLVQPSLLLDTMLGFFDTLWRLAIPVEPTLATGDPSQEERMILRGMAAGLTDEAIARELGISERTVARRISRLQDVLATRSRFQLGLQAARRGLL